MEWKVGDIAWHWQNGKAESFVVEEVSSFGMGRDIALSKSCAYYFTDLYKDRVSCIESTNKRLENAMARIYFNLQKGNRADALNIASSYAGNITEEEFMREDFD